ncbi:MAG: hypothetical protein AVDCRST_MAG22-1344, partial [uncultured Rubrobacteraceae bacterium]
ERGGFRRLPSRRRRGDLEPGPDATPGRRRAPGAPRLRGGRRLRGPEPARERGLRAGRRDAPVDRAATRPARASAGLRGHPGEGGGGRGPGHSRALAVRDLARRLAADAARDAPFRRDGPALLDARGCRRGPDPVHRQRRARRRPDDAATPRGGGDTGRGGARLPDLPRGHRVLPLVRRAGGYRGGARPRRRLRGVGGLVRPVVRRTRCPYNPGGNSRGPRSFRGRWRRDAAV